MTFDQESTTTLGVMRSWLTPTMFFMLMNLMIVSIFFNSGFSLRKKKLQNMDLKHVPLVLRTVTSISLFRFPSFNMSEQLPMQTKETTSYEADAHEKTNEEHETVSSYQPDEYELMNTETNSVTSRSAFWLFREAEMMESHLPETVTDEEALSQPMMSEEHEAVDRIEEAIDNNMSMNEIFSQLERRGSEINRTKSETEPASGAVLVKLVKKIKKSASSKSAFKHFREEDILEARRPATVKEFKKKRATDDEDDVEVDSKADDFINMFKQHLKLQRLDSILRYREMLDRSGA